MLDAAPGTSDRGASTGGSQRAYLVKDRSSPEDEYAQANAAIALLHYGDYSNFWPLLRHSPDPCLRTYLVDRLPLLTPDPQALLRRLDEEHDVSARLR